MSLVAAVGALRLALAGSPKCESYWTALARFVRFEISNSTFNAAALAALGPYVLLHNELILTLLRDSLRTCGAHAESPRPTLTPIAELAEACATSTSRPVNSLKRVREETDERWAGVKGGPALRVAPAMGPVRPSAPSLMLKIRSDGEGELAASTEKPELEVDPREEVELNALHDRLINLSKEHRLSSVQPEATAILARAVRAQVHRVIVSGLTELPRQSPAEATPCADTEQGAALGVLTVTVDDISEAIRARAASSLAPPSQQAASTMGRLNTFVS